MNKKKLIIFLISLPFLFLSTHVRAEKPVENTGPTILVEAKKLDAKAETLAAYLAKYNSPLQYHAQDFIDASETFGLDWKLLPAIAGVESTFGRHIPGGFNGWGWGVYGTQAIYFNSWREAIFTVGQNLRENYLNKGLTDPYSMNRIYASSPYWGGKVNYFMQDLTVFATTFEADKQRTTQVGRSPKTAAISGQLAFR